MSHGCSSLFPLSFCRAEVAATRKGREITHANAVELQTAEKGGDDGEGNERISRPSCGYAPRLRAATLSRDKTRSCGEEKIREKRVEKRRYLLYICRPTDRSCLTALTGKSYDDSLPPRDN